MEIKKHFREFCSVCGAESKWQVDGTIYCTPCLERETGLKVRRARMLTARGQHKGLWETAETWVFLDGSPTFGEILASNIHAEVGCLPATVSIETAKEILAARLKKWVGNNPITFSLSDEVVEWPPIVPTELKSEK
jgi:hypothetical protein